jgi:hypothetical protein
VFVGVLLLLLIALAVALVVQALWSPAAGAVAAIVILGVILSAYFTIS